MSGVKVWQQTAVFGRTAEDEGDRHDDGKDKEGRQEESVASVEGIDWPGS